MDEQWELETFWLWLRSKPEEVVVGTANALDCPLAVWRQEVTGLPCWVSRVSVVEGLPYWDEGRKRRLPAWAMDVVSGLDQSCGWEAVSVTAAQVLAVLARLQGGEWSG